MSYSRITIRSDTVATHGAVALGFSIPVAVALDNALLVLVLRGWLLGTRYCENSIAIFCNPVALVALALFTLLNINGAAARGGRSA